MRKNGQGHPGKKIPVVFPKLVFLYDNEMHGEGKPYEFLFNEAIECTRIAQYPDYLSLDEGYIGEMYHTYNQVVSPMGCRAYLSPFFKKSQSYKPDPSGDELSIYRCNLGVVSMNLPLIYWDSVQKGVEFFEHFTKYLEMIRNFNKRLYYHLGKIKAKEDPLVFCEGGFDGGTLGLEDPIAPVLKASTISFGYGGLNELQLLHNGKSLYEDGEFARKVLTFMADKINSYKEEDHILHAIYGTPGESWLTTACKQFKAMYGDVKGICSRGYFTNSFHNHVSEDITPIEKMESELRFWPYPIGGRIMYCKIPITYNVKAIKDIVRKAMSHGLYYGVNHAEDHCEDCGGHFIGDDTVEDSVCPYCNSINILQIRRMNGLRIKSL